MRSRVVWPWLLVSFLLIASVAHPVHAGVEQSQPDGFALIKQGNFDKAVTVFDQRLRANPTDAEARFGRGRAFQELDQKLKALEDYTVVIYLDPKHYKALSNRGLVKGALGNLAAALEDIDQSIHINRSFAVGYLNRGVTLGALGKPQQAVDDFTRAIQLSPDYADAYRNRGITYEFLGQLQNACRDWKRAWNLGQSDVAQWYSESCLKPTPIKVRSPVAR